MAQINDFRDLIVFQKAYDISRKIYKGSSKNSLRRGLRSLQKRSLLL